MQSSATRGSLVAAFLLVWPSAALAADPVVPLPPDVAKELELFGKGVVGKPVPARR